MKVKTFGKETYKLLLEYAFKKCSIFYLYRYFDQCFDINYKIMNIITANQKYHKENILKDYSKEFLDEIYDYYKNDLRIYKNTENIEVSNNIKLRKQNIEKCLQEYIYKEQNGIPFDLEHKYFCEEYLKNPEKIEIDVRKETIFLPVNWIYYNFITEQILINCKSNIISQKNIYLDGENSQLHGIRYVFALNEETKNMLLSTGDSIYSWCFPNNLDDLCFVKENCYWLCSTGHEKICEIYCETEEEYNYLKSIGVEFYEDHFIPQIKETLYFV